MCAGCEELATKAENFDIIKKKRKTLQVQCNQVL